MICLQRSKKIQLPTNRNMVSFEKSVNWYNHEHRQLWLWSNNEFSWFSVFHYYTSLIYAAFETVGVWSGNDLTKITKNHTQS